MRFSPLAGAVALGWLALAAAESDVLDLDATNFTEITDSEPLLLVEFFAPWCGHCKALAPHYEEAATKLKEDNIRIAKVDCVEQADLCQSQGIQGYPTLKVARKGVFSDYTGPRKADGIITYMVKQSLPAVVPVTAENFEDIKSKDRLVVIAYASSTTDAPAPVFSQLAEQYRDDYLFGFTTDAKLIAEAKVKTPTVIVYRQYDEPRSDYPYPDPASATTQDFETWIGDLAVPIFEEVNADNYALYANGEKPLAYVFVDVSVDNQALFDAIRPVATKYHPKMNFVYIDAVKFGEHAKALNIQEAKWPAFVIQDTVKQLKFPVSQDTEITAEVVADWAAKYLDGALQPELKSAPIPEQEGNVYELVGKNFEEVVFDDSKDVFVEFYASWCGHCKRLKPIWDQLGDHFANVKDRLTIAKIEAQENDLPTSIPFSIKGFPTIKFKPAGSREFLDYEGDRSLESFIEYIEKTSKNSLEAPAASEDAEADAAQKHFKVEETATTEAAAEETHVTDEL